METCKTKALSLIDLMFSADGPGVAVASFKEGSIQDAYFTGLANFDSQKKIDLGTAFHVASVSKQFTAYAIAHLISEGLVNFQDKAVQYLSFLPAQASQITIAELLYHTSGLSDQWVLLNLAGWTDKDLIRTLDINRLVERQDQLKNLPGTKFSYSNTGYTLLAQIVEVVVGQSLDEYLKSVLFGPLKLTHTRFRSDLGAILPYEAECYSHDNDGIQRITTPRFQTVGATSLRTSLLDTASWSRHLMEADSAASRMMWTMGSLKTGEPISYGFGLYHGLMGNLRTLSHSGWDADFSAHVLYVPEKAVGAAVFSNGTHTNLELIASAFLADSLEVGYVESQIEPRLSALRNGLSSRFDNVGALIEHKAYGSLSSGDVRIWEKDGGGQRLRYGTVQRAERLKAANYMLGASLSTITETDNALIISSPTQDVSQILPFIPVPAFPAMLRERTSYFSDALNVTHTLVGEEGRILWERPGRQAAILQEIGAGVFFAGGFTLQFSQEELTILNARTAPMRFRRV